MGVFSADWGYLESWAVFLNLLGVVRVLGGYLLQDLRIYFIGKASEK